MIFTPTIIAVKNCHNQEFKVSDHVMACRYDDQHTVGYVCEFIITSSPRIMIFARVGSVWEDITYLRPFKEGTPS